MPDENDIDWEKVEEVALALLSLTLHDHCRVWKGLDWDLMDHLHKRGWILDPKGKAKSVVITEEGRALAQTFFEKHFVR